MPPVSLPTGCSYRGKISFIYLTLDEKTRTVKVRIDLRNQNRELKPAMFANVVIKCRQRGVYPVIPEQAVLRSGQNNFVILALGAGKIKPMEVKLGAYADGFCQVLQGLSAGNTIVTSAQFLIDSESNLRAALAQFGGSTK